MIKNDLVFHLCIPFCIWCVRYVNVVRELHWISYCFMVCSFASKVGVSVFRHLAYCAYPCVMYQPMPCGLHFKLTMFLVPFGVSLTRLSSLRWEVIRPHAPNLEWDQASPVLYLLIHIATLDSFPLVTLKFIQSATWGMETTSGSTFWNVKNCEKPWEHCKIDDRHFWSTLNENVVLLFIGDFVINYNYYIAEWGL